MTKIRNWVAAHGLAIFVALFAAIIVTFTIVISTIVNGYEARISELESKISGLESAYEELESSIGERFSTLEGRVESVEKTVSNLEKSVQKLEEADEKMLKEMEEIAKMISNIKVEAEAEAEVEETSYEEDNYYESYNEPAWVGSSEAPVVTDISSAVEKIETQETEDNASYEAEAEIREVIREEEITSDDVVVIPEEPAEPEAVEETVSEPEVVSETVVEETTEGTIEISGGEIDGGEIDESLDEYDWDSAPVVGVGDDGSMEVVSVELDM
mgnify:CR=1 FL=1